MEVPVRSTKPLPLRTINKNGTPRVSSTTGNFNAPKKERLSWKQRKFVAYYLADPNRKVIPAALKAGYLEASAYGNAHNLLQHPAIQQAIEDADREIFRSLEITHERVLKHIAMIAFANPLDYFTQQSDGTLEVDINKLTLQQGFAIQDISITVEEGKQKIQIKCADKLAGLQMLAKRLKLFDDDKAAQTINVNFFDKLVQGEASLKDLAPKQLEAFVEDGEVNVRND